LKYRYTPEYPVLYPDYIVPGEGSLTGNPGDVRDFGAMKPPDDRWVPVQAPKPETKSAKES
jgi:hypothetical protein